MVVRLAHLSDVHITTPRCDWTLRDFLSKRVSGWVNLTLRGRGQTFDLAEQAVTALLEELRHLRPDRVIFSGDATALGFESEVSRAAELLGLKGDDPLPGLAVPGNHDYYVGRAAREGAFERHFAPWLVGERLDQAVYPFAQRIDDLWLVGVNTSVAHRFPWDASGHTGADQLTRLEALLHHLPAGPRILVTHYPVCQSCGRPEKLSHALRDVEKLIAVAKRGGVRLWLHGHQHDPYFLARTPWTPFPVICAGSATQRGRWSYAHYTVKGNRLHAIRRAFDPETGEFREIESFEIEI